MQHRVSDTGVECICKYNIMLDTQSRRVAIAAMDDLGDCIIQQDRSQAIPSKCEGIANDMCVDNEEVRRRFYL